MTWRRVTTRGGGDFFFKYVPGGHIDLSQFWPSLRSFYGLHDIFLWSNPIRTRVNTSVHTRNSLGTPNLTPIYMSEDDPPSRVTFVSFIMLLCSTAAKYWGGSRTLIILWTRYIVQLNLLDTGTRVLWVFLMYLMYTDSMLCDWTVIACSGNIKCVFL